MQDTSLPVAILSFYSFVNVAEPEILLPKIIEQQLSSRNTESIFVVKGKEPSMKCAQK